MAYWILKALTQGMLSNLPASYILRKYGNRSLSLKDVNFQLKLKECKRHLESYFSISSANTQSSFVVLELGTGWFPILPVSFFLCGTSRIFTIDRTCLLSFDRVKEVLRFFLDYASSGILTGMLPWIQKDRIAQLQSIAENKDLLFTPDVLEKMNIHCLVCDARNTGLAASSIDYFVSNTTLEYIPKDILQSIFVEFKRLAVPKALMSHMIITSDHYADVDHSITRFNFLKYPGWVWRIFNNNLHHQNRLQLSDYCRLHQHAGFEILEKHNVLGSSTDLEKIRISKEFSRYSKEDLLVTTTRIVSLFRNTCEPELSI